MKEKESVQVSLVPYQDRNRDFDLDRIIYDLDRELDLLSSHADTLDYLVSIASGVLCGLLDILWVGEFQLDRGRKLAGEGVDELVKKTAHMLGCEKEDLPSAVKFLEECFPIPSDGNTAQFGGGKQHHLRDFAHHLTPVGLVFSLLTQFTGKSYGTGTAGQFMVVDVPEASRAFIGKDVPTKLLYGTVIWFFHLVSDMAGSHRSAGRSGGTGIPGPILALAKELSALPFFRGLKVGDNSLTVLLSKLFNGTLMMRRDENGAIIPESVVKFDLRGELGLALEIGRQALPVVANECIVRAFYMLRRLALEVKEHQVRSLQEFRQLSWDRVKPAGNPTIDRMLLVSAGVFSAMDLGEAIVTQKYFIAVNYVGVGRFAVAIGKDISWGLKSRNIRKTKEAYETIRRFVFRDENNRIFEEMGDHMDMGKLGLTTEQAELLYNLEYQVVWNDMKTTKLPVGQDTIKLLKHEWLMEWRNCITEGFSEFMQDDEAEMHWYSADELIRRVEQEEPRNTWFRLMLLEAMLFEPYYALSMETDQKGNTFPSKKYNALNNPLNGFKKGTADQFLDDFFYGPYYEKGCIRRLRKCYDKVYRELSEMLKSTLISVGVMAGIALATVFAAGTFTPGIAVALVGANFAGLHGAALTGACLAYLGGGAVAAGGLGMAGGTAAIVGGGAVLGLGVGAGAGGAAGAASLMGEKNTILQSAKLITAVREVFLNDEHDIGYSNEVYDVYVNNIVELEQEITKLKLEADVADSKKKKALDGKIKQAEKTADTMRRARKSMKRFISSFEAGSQADGQ